MAMEEGLEHIRSLFEPALGTVYLDSATYGLPPRPTVEAMHKAISDWQAGAADWMRDWDRAGDAARTAFADLIGVLPETVALVPAASVGVGTIAASLHAGDQVVVPEDEFTSVLFPLLVVAQQRGVMVRTVRFDQLASSIEPATTLVAFSHIQSHSGRAAELTNIVEAARSVGARTLVDTSHATPFVPLDADVDFLICAAYKHLLCPRGVAFLYAARERWSDVAPILANWRSSSDPYGHYYGGPLDLAPTAARFDVSLAWFSWLGAARSLGLLAEWRRQGVLEEVVQLARRLARQLDLPEPVGTVLSVPVDDADAVSADLAKAGVKASVRAGSVRLAPHVYNTADDIELAADALARYVKQPARSRG